MQKLILMFLILFLIAFQNWGKIDGLLKGDSGNAAVASGEVVMYATSWCGYCQKARDFFAKNNIPYTEYDIERDGMAKDKYAEYNAPGVPLISAPSSAPLNSVPAIFAT